MTDNTSDMPDQPAETTRATCTEPGMRDTLVNLEEFAVMMSHRSSIRGLEILEVVPPAREELPVPRRQAQAGTVIAHPAMRKEAE